jgi:hypothetical protein
MNKEQTRQDLLEFARRVTREVCVRAANHGPVSPDERRWKAQGEVHPKDLDCVREALES